MCFCVTGVLRGRGGLGGCRRCGAGCGGWSSTRPNLSQRRASPSPPCVCPSSESFSMARLTDFSVLLLDTTAQVTGDQLVRCQLLIGPCSGSVFLRNCRNCIIHVAWYVNEAILVSCGRGLRWTHVSNWAPPCRSHPLELLSSEPQCATPAAELRGLHRDGVCPEPDRSGELPRTHDWRLLRGVLGPCGAVRAARSRSGEQPLEHRVRLLLAVGSGTRPDLDAPGCVLWTG